MSMLLVITLLQSLLIHVSTWWYTCVPFIPSGARSLIRHRSPWHYHRQHSSTGYIIPFHKYRRNETSDSNVNMCDLAVSDGNNREKFNIELCVDVYITCAQIQPVLSDSIERTFLSSGQFKRGTQWTTASWSCWSVTRTTHCTPESRTNPVQSASRRRRQIMLISPSYLYVCMCTTTLHAYRSFRYNLIRKRFAALPIRVDEIR